MTYDKSDIDGFKVYIPKDKFTQPPVIDIYKDIYYLTWMQFENKRTFTQMPGEILNDDEIDDGSIIYNYNSSGFRCDEFKKEHSGLHILFGGCSNTEGQGASLETVWSNILYKKISKDFSVDGFYSLARAGYGWQNIITSFLKYTKDNGYPDYFFVLMPNLSRVLEWDSSNNLWEDRQLYLKSFFHWDRDNNSYNNILTEKQHREVFVNFSRSWKLFERFCESVGTKLIWSSWNYMENDNFINANIFPGFFPLDEKEFDIFFLKVRPDAKLKNKHDLLRRDNHYGIVWHEWWAEEFYNQIDIGKN